MRAEMFWITGPWDGRVGIVPRPRGGDWLEDEIDAWKNTGIDVVVSTLTREEVTELGLNQEEQYCQSAGLRFLSFPIVDRGVPESYRAAAALVKDLNARLTDGKNVVFHCRQGIGRSGLMAAAMLVDAGEDVESAWASVEKARRRRVPDTDEQRDWLTSLSSLLPSIGNTDDNIAA